MRITNGGYSPHTIEFRLLSNSFVDILTTHRNTNKIANRLLALNRVKCDNTVIRNITLRKDKTMSFCPAGKDTVLKTIQRDEDILSDILGNDVVVWDNNNRQEGKYGKIIKKVLKEQNPDFEYTLKELEQLVNKLKGEVTQGDFSIVKGDDIAKIYSYNVGEEISGGLGSLSDSCMQGSNTDYFNIYVNHPEIVSMLLLKDGDNIIGRALLWKKGVKTYMDRIYGIDSTIQKFKDYAKEHKIIRKLNQSYNDKVNWVLPSGRRVKRFIDIELDTDQSYFPYLDTFTYMRDGVLSNNIDSEWSQCCHFTGGDTEENGDFTNCTISGRRIRYERDAIYIYNHEYYVHQRYAARDDFNGDYNLKTESIKLWNGNFTHRHSNNLINCYGRGNIYAHVRDTFKCAYDGRNYLSKGDKAHSSVSLVELNVVVHEKNVKKMYKKANYIYVQHMDKWLTVKEFLNAEIIRKAMALNEDLKINIETAKVPEAYDISELEGLNRSEIRKIILGRDTKSDEKWNTVRSKYVRLYGDLNSDSEVYRTKPKTETEESVYGWGDYSRNAFGDYPYGRL